MEAAQRWGIVIVFAMLLVGMLAPGAANAASGRTVYVDDNGVAHSAVKGACGKPNYSSVQAAVNDTTAGVVVVCKGTYVEQVTVERSLTLEGRSGAVIKAPAGDVLAIVQFRGPQQSILRGFTLTGAGSNVGAGVRTSGFVCEDRVCGPTQVSISRNRISDIYSSGDFGIGGTGIFLFQSEAHVKDNTVERYGSIGISADGDDRANTSAQIDGNIIRGQGQGGTRANQVGIRLDETTADVEDNTISGNYGNRVDGVGYGILVAFANGSIRDNALTDNNVGVHFGPGDGTVLRSNTIRTSASNGIELFNTTNATIVENESSNNGSNGIYVAAGATGNTVKDNNARGNGAVDLFDANTKPLVNTYTANSCGTSNPSGLCK